MVLLFFVQGIDVPEEPLIPLIVSACLLVVDYNQYFVGPADWLIFEQPRLPNDFTRFLFKNKATFATV